LKWQIILKGVVKMEVQELTKKELDLNEYFNWLRVYTNKHQKIRTDIWTELNLSDANHIMN